MKLIIFFMALVFAMGFAPGGFGQAAGPATSSDSAQTVQSNAPSPGSPAASPGSPAAKRANWPEGDRCVQDKEIRDEIKSDIHPIGPEMLPSTYFLPAGGPVEIGINEPFNPSVLYFGYIERLDNSSQQLLTRGAITSKRVPDDYSLVKKGLLDKGDTLLTVEIPNSIGGFWRGANLYVWVCGTTGRPKSVSELTMPVSSPLYCSISVWVSMLILYLGAALAASSRRKAHWYRYLDPVYMTASADGKGSLAKLQILFFSMIIAGLLAYIVARTGVLSDLSETILLLLGIAAFGSAAAKGTDMKVNRLEPDNAAWLIQRGWLKVGLDATNEANWRDIISSDGEFDVYRYQSCIFSVIVGGALIAGGISELASFEIPNTLLGILGLSQVVYVGGKLVMPTSLSELNTAVTELRTVEKGYLEAALAHQDPNPAAGGDVGAVTRRRAGEQNYKKYVDKAERVAIQFKSATGFDAPSIALQPPAAA
jgi:hypothetical protein